MVRILVIGDIHGDVEAVIRTVQFVSRMNRLTIDLVLLVGDFVTFCGPRKRNEHDLLGRLTLDALEAVFAALRCPVYAVAGNHDRPEWLQGREVIRSLDCLNGGKYIEEHGIRLLGVGGSERLGGFPFEWTDSDLRRGLSEELPEPDGSFEVLLAHSPPLQSGVDTASGGEQVGSSGLRRVITQRQPRFFICGHIHEGAGWGVIENCYVLNAGLVGYTEGFIKGASPLGPLKKLEANVWSGARFNVLIIDPATDCHRGIEFIELPRGFTAVEVLLHQGGIRQRAGDVLERRT